MHEVRASEELDVEVASLAACVSSVFELAPHDLPDLPPDAALMRVRQWLAARNIGLAEVADPGSFSWPGYWLARVLPEAAPPRWVVMFGVPSDVVWDPTGSELGEVRRVAGLLPAPLALTEALLAGGLPFDGAAGEGQVELICIAPAACEPVAVVESARALRGRGLEGDRYAIAAGTFSQAHSLGGALTLIEGEVIDDLEHFDGTPFAAHEARRNIVTRGIRLDALIGRRFFVGEVECYGQRRCEPCAHLQRLTRPGLLRALVHRGGLRADILGDGVIGSGDRIRAIHPSGRFGA